jgi:hypothetical protein
MSILTLPERKPHTIRRTSVMNPEPDPPRDYQVTLAAWFLCAVVTTLATHRERRRRPWL